MTPSYLYTNKEYTVCGNWSWTKAAHRAHLYWVYGGMGLPGFSFGNYAVHDDFGNLAIVP